MASPGATGWFAALGPQYGGTIFAGSLLGLREQAARIAEKSGKQLHFEPQLSASTYDKVYRAKVAREEADAAQAKARSAIEVALAALVEAGFSVRDAAVTLELSHQRVHQLVGELFPRGTRP